MLKVNENNPDRLPVGYFLRGAKCEASGLVVNKLTFRRGSRNDGSVVSKKKERQYIKLSHKYVKSITREFLRRSLLRISVFLITGEK